MIADDAGSVLVDAGHSPAVARQIRDAIDAAGLAAPRRLIYTSPLGSRMGRARGLKWRSSAIGSLPGCSRRMRDAHGATSTCTVASPRTHAGSKLPRAGAGDGHLWEGFAVIPPHTEFDESISLPGGIEVHHVRSRHAEDSTVVAVPDSGVLLLGDSIYPPPYHLIEPGDGYDGTLIRRLLDVEVSGGYEWYVDSHSNPRSRGSAPWVTGN